MTKAHEHQEGDRTLIPLALASLPGVGPVTIRQLLQTHASADAAFAAAAPDPVARRRAIENATRVRVLCSQQGIDLIAAGDDHYPSTLLSLEDFPPVLYAKGRLTLANAPSVALVGARRATSYGLHVAATFARQLAQAGVSVVSGLAMGIDAAAHAAALDVNGATIAVQGTGVDVPYPRSNLALHTRMTREALVLSELPPGRSAHPGAFPRRNRLIAALADVVVVIEAGAKSGSLITAQIAGALGRIVAGVPGPIDRESCVGSNNLLRDGAHVVASVDDVLALLALTPRGRTGIAALTLSNSPDQASLDLDEQRQCAFPDDSTESSILRVLAFGPQGPDELVRACKVSPKEIGIALANLLLTEVVHVDSSGMAQMRRGRRLVQPA